MCLAIPGKVKEINGREALIEYPNETRRALVGVDGIEAGDYVLVQMGIAINKLSKADAEVSLKAWQSDS